MGKSFAISANLDKAAQQAIKMAMFAVIAELKGIELMFEEVKQHVDQPLQKRACLVKLQTLMKAGTWEIVSQPLDHNMIGSKWVLWIKKKAGGIINKYKAYLVARGFTQVEGVDYFVIFGPVAKLAALCIILVITAYNNWEIQVFNFYSTFLNEEFNNNKKLYIKQSLDLQFAYPKKFILCLCKTIYSLKQSSRKWYKKLTAAFATLDFTPLKKDHTVFRLVQDVDIIILAIHVDNCTITGSSPFIMAMQDCIGQLFKIMLLGPIDWLLGLEIIRDQTTQSILLESNFIH